MKHLGKYVFLFYLFIYFFAKHMRLSFLAKLPLLMYVIYDPSKTVSQQPPSLAKQKDWKQRGTASLAPKVTKYIYKPL